MKRSEINKYQSYIFEALQEIYTGKGFEKEEQDWSFRRENVAIRLPVNTSIGLSYTIRPCFYCYHTVWLEKIRLLLMNDTELLLKVCGFFNFSTKLSRIITAEDYNDNMKPSFADWTPVSYAIYAKKDAKYFVKRHLELMDEFGWKAFSIFNDEKLYYVFLKKRLESFLSDKLNNSKKTKREIGGIYNCPAFLLLILISIDVEEDLSYLIKDIRTVLGDSSLFIRYLKVVFKNLGKDLPSHYSHIF